MKRRSILILCLMLFLCASCKKKETNPASSSNNTQYPTETEATPGYTIEELLLPLADGEATKSDQQKVLIDYSHTEDGYIQIKSLTTEHKRIKILVYKGADSSTYDYQYDLNKELEYVTIPLNMGDGSYKIRVMEYVNENGYAMILGVTMNVKLRNETMPYLYPNQVVDYTLNTKAIEKSFQLTEGLTTELERIKAIYDWVTNNIRYDWDKVEEVQGKYVLPILDETMSEKKGICFDYAALLAAMLRAQHIPVKVKTGYVDDGYHAWVEIYSESEGWINPDQYFAKETWERNDPTYDASGYQYKGGYEDKLQY